MVTNNLRKAVVYDVDVLAKLFIKNLKKHPEYISHGEIQMGVGTADGKVAPNASEMWKKYIVEKIERTEAEVFICEEGGGIIGFTVVEIDNDGGEPFGVICDLYVLPENRIKGLGSLLLNEGLSWLRSNGIKDFYLESGNSNVDAHIFFEKRGFSVVSHVYYKQTLS